MPSVDPLPEPNMRRHVLARRLRAAVRNPRAAAERLTKPLGELATNPRAALYRLTAPWASDRVMRVVTAFPVTFADKLRYKMVRDRRPLIADFADKVRAKEYVARVVGAEYAVDVLAVFEDAASIRVDDLPDEFVIKVTHASCGMIFVRHDAPADARLPEPGSARVRHAVRPAAFDVARARDVFAGWLATPHGAKFGEWAYSVHPPRIVVEPMLRAASGGPLRDVKLNVLNGRVATISVIEERASGRASTRYLRDGTRLDHVRSRPYLAKFHPPAESPIALPEAVAEMIDVAERVAAETDYLRVDLLDLGDRFLVGELTNYPASGMGTTRPASFSRWLGRQWTLPPRYESRS